MFERSKDPPAFRVQPRDLEIVRQVFRHRFVRPEHIHLLLGGSAANLARRCRLLWEHGFLERPLAQRPAKFLVEQLVYGLGSAGVVALRELDPRLRDIEIEWVETPKKQRGWPYLEHCLGVADFFVALQSAVGRHGLELRWGGHVNVKRHKVRAGKVTIQPDGYFVLRDAKTNREAHYFLEIDRASVSLRRMRERFIGYYKYWKEQKSSRPFEHFRVLTVAPNETHLAALRNAASSVGVTREHERAWWGLWFTDARMVDLSAPGNLLEAVFVSASDDTPRSLVERSAAA